MSSQSAPASQRARTGKGASTPNHNGALRRHLRALPATILPPALSIFGLIALWELLVRAFNIAPYLLPLPTEIAAVLMAEWSGQLAGQTFVTFQESLYGFLLAIIVSFPLAIAITYSRTLARAIYPIMVIAQVVPKVAIAPVLVIWLGFGMLPKVLVAFLVAFFVIVINLVVGLNSVSPGMIDLGRSMGASRLQLFLRFRLPQALPSFFGGLKVGVTFAVVGAVVGEFVGSGTGLGHLVLIAMGSLDLPLVYACIVLMALIGIVMFGAVQVAERIAIPWNQSTTVEDLSKGA